MAASENAALKNIAPFKRTPFKASENASIFLRPPPDARQHFVASAHSFLAPIGRSGKNFNRAGMASQ